MATLTITVPETAQISASEFLESAARGYGWDEAHGITAEEMIVDQIVRDLHHRFRSGATHLSRDEVEAELPIPESRAEAEAVQVAEAGGERA